MNTRLAVPLTTLTTFLAMAACNATMPPRHRQYILEKAPADLECERAKIHFKSLGHDEYEVWGCGAKAAYRVVCNERTECEAQTTRVPVPIRDTTPESTHGGGQDR
jgi:hypothetical protein